MISFSRHFFQTLVIDYKFDSYLAMNQVFYFIWTNITGSFVFSLVRYKINLIHENTELKNKLTTNLLSLIYKSMHLLNMPQIA